ncbi:hypothetical protein CWATWH8502_2137 [Crocosphaera watsonii WH 8502]|uniref:Uncharacterized protein n=2 Tax=Crocosphaera watsonii TaxID=263511 RepID=T2JAL4_CROWT|nr:hypothetical protein CWATWH8502_2137 [Crocosphaera watsonii WH 8502]CCQ62883.1 hypothetical protein CWATWH0401_4935 [Crocosphaera watsonii WH 0401]
MILSFALANFYLVNLQNLLEKTNKKYNFDDQQRLKMLDLAE